MRSISSDAAPYVAKNSGSSRSRARSSQNSVLVHADYPSDLGLTGSYRPRPSAKCRANFSLVQRVLGAQSRELGVEGP